MIALIGPGMAGAQGEIPIAYGQTVTGTITSQQYGVVYVFQGQAGDVVTITMTRTETTLDPYLGLLDANNTVLVEDDDSGGERDAMITHTLPAAGTYYIVATRFGIENGASTGGFRLTLSAVSGGGTTGGTGGTGGSGGAFGGLPIGGGSGGAGGTGAGGTGAGTAGSGGQDLAFLCDNVSVPAATLVTFEDVRPGFSYRVTVLGLDGFDPVIGLEAADGSGLCNDDEPRAAGSQVAVPGVGLVEADALTSQIQFTTSGSVGDIQMRIGGFGGRGGRYVAVFEGLAIFPANEQDAVTINVSDSIINEDLFVYMVAQAAGLDPIMGLAGSDIICDDAGVGPCANTPPFPGGGVHIANGETYIAGQFDAGIGIVPRDTGDRTFLFESYQGRTQGDYAMIVIGAAPGAGGGSTSTTSTGGGTAPSDIPVIAYGDMIPNTIDDANWGWVYSFNGTAGDQVTITMERVGSSTVDPYLYLLDPSETVIAEDDDSAGNLNAQINVTLPVGGTYYIIATRFNMEQGASSGPFALMLNSSGAGASGQTGAQQVAPDQFTLTYGQQAQNVIDNADWGWVYSFNGTAGDIVTIAMDAAPGSSVDPYLALFDPNENLLVEDDDGGGGLNSLIANYRLPVTGTYFVLAMRYNGEDGTSTGAFTLRLTSSNASSSGTTGGAVSLPGGSGTGGQAAGATTITETAEDVIDNANWGRLYPFEGQAGNLVTITMAAAPGSTLDPYLGLMDANDNILAEDDNSGGGTTAQISFVLPDSGSYTIVATRRGLDKGTTSGAFVLTLTTETAVRSGSFIDSELDAGAVGLDENK